MPGYYKKFTVTRTDTGEEVQEDTFTLIPAHDKHAEVALSAYANSVQSENPDLASDLRRLIAGQAL